MASVNASSHEVKAPEQGLQEAQSTVNVVPQGVASPVNPKPSNEPSNAEKKKLAKAEKAAKRAKAKETENPVINGAVVSPNVQSGGGKQSSEGKSPAQTTTQHKRTGSMGSASALPKPLPLRRRQSQSASNEAKPLDNQVAFFSHLYGQPRRRNLQGPLKEIHPAILALALQQSNYIICGSHSRCVAMLLALKSVISSYATPHGTSLPRHLASNYLSPQLSYLKSARPFSTSQANSIRWLKNLIANLDPSMAEDDAKSLICSSIDTFIGERFTIADQVIADATAERIQDGDVVLTFGKSAVVQAALVHAASGGVKFRLVIVDGRPLKEGRHLAQALGSHVDIGYCLLPGLNHALTGVTKCILGAHAIFANGCLQSRVGTALVAMAAKLRRIPVMVCAESIKLTDRVAMNSIIINELAPEEEILDQPSQYRPQMHVRVDEPNSAKPVQSGTKEAKGSKQQSDTGDSRKPKVEDGGILSIGRWREKENLQLLNILYDVTPSHNIDLIITELGSFPPSSASVVHRISIGS